MSSNERSFNLYIIWLYSEKSFTTYRLRSHNAYYLTFYILYLNLIFNIFWSRGVLLKIGHYTKINLMIYNCIRMFGKITFVVIVRYEVIGMLAIKSLEKCGRNVFDCFTYWWLWNNKNWIILVARFRSLQ